jgi:hypothetical protein
MPAAVAKIVPDQAMSKGAATLLLAFGALVLLTSMLGCATARLKQPYVAIPFGLLTFVFGLVLLIVGLITMAAAAGAT